jgi:hypothetical protein
MLQVSPVNGETITTLNKRQHCRQASGRWVPAIRLKAQSVWQIAGYAAPA